MTSRAIRTLRGGIAAAVAIEVALLSHVLAGGAAPDALLVALTFVVSWIVCLALAGRRLSLVRLALAVGLSQFAFHAAFSVLGTPQAAAASGGAHAHHAMTMDAAPHATAMVAADPLMWAAHALAAVVTIAALYRGERAVRALLEPLVTLVRAVVHVVMVTPARPRRLAAARIENSVLPGRRWVAEPATRRGPPRGILLPAI
ncbi:hypothetical protein [Microbacterium sp. NPDC064584]|uniref:hypothetical protein n=1 Tax=Microbacterium sp. NPDC064584 TaxID=3155817 RepID=UPI00342E20DD